MDYICYAMFNTQRKEKKMGQKKVKTKTMDSKMDSADYNFQSATQSGAERKINA